MIAHEFHKTVPHEFKLSYLLHLPADYDESRTYPMILFLHGAGERGSDLNLVKLNGIPRKLDQGEDLPFIVVAPQCPADHSWMEYAPDLLYLVDEISASYAVDKSRVYLTGLSMGGFGTWHIALWYPERFAAFAPICGGLPWLVDLQRAAQSLKSLPIWAFHGAKDQTVPPEASQVVVDAVKAAGGESIHHTVYPDLEHNSWTVTYDNPELYQWFLSYAR